MSIHSKPAPPCTLLHLGKLLSIFITNRSIRLEIAAHILTHHLLHVFSIFSTWHTKDAWIGFFENILAAAGGGCIAAKITYLVWKLSLKAFHFTLTYKCLLLGFVLMPAPMNNPLNCIFTKTPIFSGAIYPSVPTIKIFVLYKKIFVLHDLFSYK